MLKRKWQVLSVMFLVLLPTAIHISSLVPLYQASATMLIEDKKSKVVSIEDLYGTDTGSQGYLQTQIELMRSRYLVEEVIRQERLDLAEEFNPRIKGKRRGWTLQNWIPQWLRVYLPPEEEAPEPEAADQSADLDPVRFGALVDAVTGRISVAPVQKSQLVRVAFISESPDLAARVATAVAQIYIDQKLEARLQMTQHAAGWLMKRLEGLRTSLEESERALQEYREQSGLVGSQEKESMEGQQLSAINVRWLQAQARRTEAQIRYDRFQALMKEYQGQLSEMPLDDNQLVVNLKKEATRISLKLSELSARYGDKHPQIIRTRAELEGVKEKITEEVKRSIATMKHDFTVSQLQESKAAQQFTDQKMRLQEYQKKAFNLGNLEREVEANRQLYDMFQKRFKETGVSEGMEPGNARIVDPAKPPRGSFAPRKKRSMVLAAMVGLVLGILLALFLEHMDRTVHNPDELEQLIGLPILATLSKLKLTGDNTPSPESMVVAKPRSPYAEAIRTVRTSILLENTKEPYKVIMVTSTLPSEGKTTLAINLAQAFHQSGDRVLLMDADLRKPRLNTVFDVKVPCGISHLFSGVDLFSREGGGNRMIAAGPEGERQLLDERRSVRDAITSSVEGLHLLPCQETIPFPSEALTSNKWRRIMVTLRQDYDRIIIDSPPVLAVTDARIVGAQADAVVFVVRAGVSQRELILDAVRQLFRSGSRVLGLVLNDIDTRKMARYGSGKGYGYGYGSTYGYGYGHGETDG